MKKSHLLAVALLAGMVTAAQAETCRVTDPTGTKLNVRAAPNGLKLGTLRNGTQVSIISGDEDEKSRPWILIRWKGQPLDNRILRRNGMQHEGWVIREFVSCYGN